MVLSTIVLAATVEVAALLWEKDGVPVPWAVFEPWESAIRAALSGGAAQRDPKDALFGLSRVVPC